MLIEIMHSSETFIFGLLITLPQILLNSLKYEKNPIDPRCSMPTNYSTRSIKFYLICGILMVNLVEEIILHRLRRYDLSHRYHSWEARLTHNLIDF